VEGVREGRGLIQNLKSKIVPRHSAEGNRGESQTGSEETVLRRLARERRQERTILNNSSE
jgi:hypothetical protein